MQAKIVPQKRVLVVDDEPAIRRVLAKFLSRRGYEVDLAESGLEAIRLAEDFAYPVVLTDLSMPGLDGLTLIERLRHLLPSSVYLVITGMSDLQLRPSEATDGSIAGIVRKPWAPEELMSSIERAFDMYTQMLSEVKETQQLLLVEDSLSDAELVCHYMSASKAPYKIVHCQRLSEALEAINDEDFRVAVVDLSLPDARGLDAVLRINAAAPELPLLVLSGLNDESLALQAVQSGAQDYLVKNEVNPATLARATRYAIERKGSEKKLAHLAYYDQVTGLPNRSLFRDRLGHAIARSKRDETALSAMFLDLDRFKAINDGYGHDVGDQLLKTVGSRLQSVLRETDTVARLGGDEFAILLERTSGEAEARAVAGRILEAMESPILCAKDQIVVSTSVGIAMYPEHGYTVEGLLKSADAAMYEAKSHGRACYRMAGDQSQGDSVRRLRVESALRMAMDRQEFSLHYQPQFNLATGQIEGFEALLRWNPTETEGMPPSEFIPILEELRLTVAVGAWVIEEACRQLAEWRDQGFSHWRVSVNLSADQFEVDLVGLVQSTLAKYGLPPSLLELEITERTVMHNTDLTLSTLSRLRELGVRLAIDDFGTGFSSLAYLKRFPVDVLKIDKEFVKGLVPEAEDASIASAVVALGHSLHVEVVAEGIETAAQALVLTALGCDLGQGFYYGRPMAAAEVPAWSATLAWPQLSGQPERLAGADESLCA